MTPNINGVDVIGRTSDNPVLDGGAKRASKVRYLILALFMHVY